MGTGDAGPSRFPRRTCTLAVIDVAIAALHSLRLQAQACAVPQRSHVDPNLVVSITADRANLINDRDDLEGTQS